MTLRMKPILLLLLALCVIPAAANVPEIDDSARVKQHRAGANGDLVEGQEDMRKIIIQWHAIPGATKYEVCHNCQDMGDGVVEGGDVHDVSTDQTRGGRPMYIKYDAPLGLNTFHVRSVLEGGKVSDWSAPKNFHVDEPGNAAHEEL